jgi:hypothetical protein
MTGDTSTAVSIICPSCGERYDSAERVTDILRNSGFCVNITCLQDLSSAPLEAALAPRSKKEATRRMTDRRAI